MLKQILIEGVDYPVTMARRKGTRSLRLSIKSDGVIRVTVPHGVPELLAKKFVQSKADWIHAHVKPRHVMTDGAHIGKNHKLSLLRTDAERPTTRVTATEVRVSIPHKWVADSVEVQEIIRKACEKALLQEAKILLPQRLEYLSKQYSIPYKSLAIKKLKSRWGACDSHNNLSLNSYLIQLDWSLIDYVICHELAHTQHHHHKAPFWDLVASMMPDYKARRKIIKEKPTDIQST